MKKISCIFLFVLAWMSFSAFGDSIGEDKLKEVGSEVELQDESSVDEGSSQGKRQLYKKRRETNESILEVAFTSKGNEKEDEEVANILEQGKNRIGFIKAEEDELLRYNEELGLDVEKDGPFINKNYELTLKKIQEKQSEIDEISRKQEKRNEQYNKLNAMESRLK